MQETKERFFIFIDKLEDKLKEFAEAAYDYGYDGAEWILNNFGINPGDSQAVAMQCSGCLYATVKTLIL